MLLGALVAAEKLIIQPIEMMAATATRFGQGEWSVRARAPRLPAEFVPLARAFNAMAAQLGKRERELVATNDRLTVMASIDMLSGLANRRGFQSRLDFEWMKAQQNGSELSLLMIDVDHFKLFNDTYGHPEGDACLSRLGETLSGIAAETMGFAGRYGGDRRSVRRSPWSGRRCDVAEPGQAGVAFGMAIGVVEQLEVIDVDHQQRQLAVILQGLHPFEIERLWKPRGWRGRTHVDRGHHGQPVGGDQLALALAELRRHRV